MSSFPFAGRTKEETTVHEQTMVTHEVQQTSRTDIQVVKKESRGEPLYANVQNGDTMTHINSDTVLNTHYSEETTTSIDDRAPLFLVPLFDQVVELGDTAILETRIDGDPMPKVKWFLDGEEVTNKKLYDFVYSSTGEICLVVKEMFALAQGQYLCMATNEFGSASSFASLTLPGLFY